jgi:hypothetical protein
VDVARHIENSYVLPTITEKASGLGENSNGVPGRKVESGQPQSQLQLQPRQQFQAKVKAGDVQIKEPAKEKVQALGNGPKVDADVEENGLGIPVRNVGDMDSPIRELDVFENEIYYRTMSEADFEKLQGTGVLPKGQEVSISPSQEYSSRYKGITVRITVKAGTSEKLRAIAIAANPKTAEKTGVLYQKGQWRKHVRFKSEGDQMTTQLGSGSGLILFNENILKVEQVEKIKKLKSRRRRAIRRRARNSEVSSRLRKNAARSRRGRY